MAINGVLCECPDLVIDTVITIVEHLTILGTHLGIIKEQSSRS